MPPWPLPLPHLALAVGVHELLKVGLLLDLEEELGAILREHLQVDVLVRAHVGLDVRLWEGRRAG